MRECWEFRIGLCFDSANILLVFMSKNLPLLGTPICKSIALLLLVTVSLSAAESESPVDATVTGAGLISSDELPEPSDEETQILIHINAMRLSPRSESYRIMAGAEGGIPGMSPRLDYEKCLKELLELKAAPPLVFDQHLIRSARAHAQYMITHDVTTHDEEPGKEDYTGRKPFERIATAGYRGYPMGENAFQYAVSPWHSHRGFMIDWGGDADGMQAGRGHRRACMSPMNREIGIGALRFKKDKFLSTCHNFGFSKSVPRFLGGVIFVDKNSNGVYDPGEGKGGLTIQSNSGEQTKTWNSGAFTLALRHRERFEIKIISSTGGQTQELDLWKFSAGKENVWLYTQLKDKKDTDSVAKLLLRAQPSARDKIHPLDLWWLSKDLYQTQEQVQAINEYCADEIYAFNEAMNTCLRAYGDGDKRAFKSALQQLKKEYRANKAWAWFDAAEKSFEAYRETKSLIDTIRAGRPIPSTSVSKHLRLNKRAQSKVKIPLFDDILQSQIEVLAKTLGKR